MSNYTAPAAPTAAPSAPPSSSQPPPGQDSGGSGPYLPRNAVLGGRPTIPLDIPICTVFLVLFILAATFNMAIFQINKKHGYKFLFSGLLFGFCMARIVALASRIAWAVHDTDINIAIASQIFTAAGVILLFVTNLIFAQRIIRAYHPFFGWSRPVGVLFGFLFGSIVAILVTVIAVTVHNFFTLDTAARQTDRAIQLFCGVWLAAMAFLPIPLALIAVVIPRRTRIDKFGQGHFSTKFGLLLFTAALLATGAVFRATTNFFARPVADPAWYHSKACYYCFNFGIEVLVVYIYALSRFDKRFHIPDGSSAPGHYSCSEDGRSPVRSGRTSVASSARHHGDGSVSGRRHSTAGQRRRSHQRQSRVDMVMTTDLEGAGGGGSGGGILKQPAAAHVRSSKRFSTALSSGHSRKGGKRSSGMPPGYFSTSTSSLKNGILAPGGYGGNGHGGDGRPKSVKSAPRSVRSFYGPGAEGAARSEADIATMVADMEWMARAMRELYGDEEAVDTISLGRKSNGQQKG
ncbi:Protein of unknown function (DUF3112) domain containing protein [Rhypophila sp. PSN 637]